MKTATFFLMMASFVLGYVIGSRKGPYQITEQQEKNGLLTVAEYTYEAARFGVSIEKITNNIIVCYPWGRARH